MLRAFYRGGTASMYRSGDRPGDRAQIRRGVRVDRSGGAAVARAVAERGANHCGKLELGQCL